MAATGVHHLNFVVRDLDESIAQFRLLLGGADFEVFDLETRGSRVARTRVGDSWLVLVCPWDGDSAPGRFLAAHGEGFFLLSFGTNDLDAALAELEASGIEPGAVRQGIDDWRVADVGSIGGVTLQLTDSRQ